MIAFHEVGRVTAARHIMRFTRAPLNTPSCRCGCGRGCCTGRPEGPFPGGRALRWSYSVRSPSGRISRSRLSTVTSRTTAVAMPVIDSTFAQFRPLLGRSLSARASRPTP